MMREWQYTASTQDLLYTYTAERRDVLGCTSPTTKRFPEAGEMSRGRSPRDISRAEGNLEVGGDVQTKTSRFEAVYGHSLIINLSLGMYQEIRSSRVSSIDSVKINTSLPNDERMGCTSPPTKRFPEAREMSQGRSPRDILRAEVNLEVGGDVIPIHPPSRQRQCMTTYSMIVKLNVDCTNL